MALTQVDQGLLGTYAQYTGFKNRIINGAMAIDQRNAGASISLSNSYAYDVDRWWCQNANVGTAQQVTTSDSDFPYALRLKRTSGNTGTGIVTCGQVIESVNCKDLAGQSVTLSVYLTAGSNFSAASSQVYLSIITGTGTDQGSLSGFGNATWTGWANTLATATTISTTRTRYSATVTIPAGTNEIGARIYWYPTGTAGTNDYVDVTGFQLEKGSTATSFDYRPYGTEFQLCQRYYEQWNVSSATYVGNAFAYSTTGVRSVLQFQVPKRSATTTTFSGSLNFSNTGKNATITSFSFDGNSVNSVLLYNDSQTGFTTGQGLQMQVPGGSSATLAFSAEL